MQSMSSVHKKDAVGGRGADAPQAGNTERNLAVRDSGASPLRVASHGSARGPNKAPISRNSLMSSAGQLGTGSSGGAVEDPATLGLRYGLDPQYMNADHGIQL